MQHYKYRSRRRTLSHSSVCLGKGSATMTGIIPRSKAKGTDIFGAGEDGYIIRSDLGCYMKTSDLNKGSDISIFSLHPSCRNGDHYLSDHKSSFFIIKGNSYRRVTDLTIDSDAEVFSLHPDCRGGDHYLATNYDFYIIFQEKATYRVTTNMNENLSAVEYDLPPDWRNGLYYWGMADCCYFLKPASEWGVEYYKGGELSRDYLIILFKKMLSGVYSVHPDVLTFLPGGLSVTKGPSFGRWEIIKTITNDSNTPVTWQKKINKKVGYNKEKMTEITHNWKKGVSSTVEYRALSKLITKVQLSLSTEYGGSHVSTEKESWEEATEEEEQLSFELKPNESVYLWQYKLGFGEDPVLFCRDLKITSDPNPPTEVPLPPAQP
ncbi:uncharacterized protein [Pseudorasbora parva]|uniref:uncharacterized protein n=1 Tax=Pseudorasbora parva TaxID=51549 RepID=UPI00351F1AF6